MELDVSKAFLCTYELTKAEIGLSMEPPLRGRKIRHVL
jgi:hypothetical protein